MLSGDSPFIENLSKEERKARRSQRRTTRKGKVAEAKTKVKETAKRVGKIAVLAPFRIPMMTILKSKGITPKKDLSDLARQFYMEVVKKDAYETELDFEAGDNVAVDYSNMPSFMQENLVDPVTITAIVSGILSFFQGVKDKKAAGEPLTKTQQVALKAGEAVEKESTQIAMDEIEEGIGETVTGAAGLIKSNIGIIIGIAAVAIGIYFYSKKK